MKGGSDRDKSDTSGPAKCFSFFFISQSEHHKQGQNQVLDYTPKKGRSSLLSSHLLSNGVVGDSSETAEGVW